MRLRTLYLLAAGVLAVPVALAVAFQVLAWAAGFSWLFLFGDAPWPEGAQGYLIAVALAAGLATLAAGLLWGYLHGRGQEAGNQPERALRRGYVLLLAGALVWLALGWLAVRHYERQDAERARDAAAEAAFRHLRDTRHVIASISLADDAPGEIEAILILAGTRRGPYRLTWRLVDPSHGVALLEGARELLLDEGEALETLYLHTRAVALRYRETVLGGRDDPVQVDGAFRLELALEPELAAEERQALPKREIGNIERGYSQLRFETEASVRMALDLTRD